MTVNDVLDIMFANKEVLVASNKIVAATTASVLVRVFDNKPYYYQKYTTVTEQSDGSYVFEIFLPRRYQQLFYTEFAEDTTAFGINKAS